MFDFVNRRLKSFRRVREQTRLRQRGLVREQKFLHDDDGRNRDENYRAEPKRCAVTFVVINRRLERARLFGDCLRLKIFLRLLLLFRL